MLCPSDHEQVRKELSIISGVKRGQNLEVEAEAKSLRPRPKFWHRGHFGLEDLISLAILSGRPNFLRLITSPLISSYLWSVGLLLVTY